MLQLLLAVALSAVPLTLYVPPIRSLKPVRGDGGGLPRGGRRVLDAGIPADPARRSSHHGLRRPRAPLGG